MENKDLKIFILSGKARAGKDSTAQFIKKYYEENNKKVINLQISFYIKMYAKFISDWDGSEETKPRTLLQELGTDVIRKNIDNLFFIKRIIQDILVCSYYCDVITISDARLPEELDEIAKAYPNVTKINLTRPDTDNELSSNQKKHITETGLDNYNNFDYKIINDGTLEDLNHKTIEILKNLK